MYIHLKKKEKKAKKENEKKGKKKKKRKEKKCYDIFLYNKLLYWVLISTFGGRLLGVFVIRDLCEIFMGVFIPCVTSCYVF